MSPPLTAKGETGFRPDPVSEPDISWVFRGGLGHNVGGRPRKDGSRADARPTLADAGWSKRDVARMRLLAELTDDEFDAALARFDAEWIRTGRKPAFERFVSKRGDNTRIERDYHGDCSQAGESMRLFVEMMRVTWREWAHSAVRNDQ